MGQALNNGLAKSMGVKTSRESRIKAAALDVVTAPVQAFVIPTAVITNQISKETPSEKNRENSD